MTTTGSKHFPPALVSRYRLRGVAASFNSRFRIDAWLNSILESRPSRASRRFQVLTYHRISPERHPFFPPLDPGLFERHLLFLQRHYRIYDIHELVDRSLHGLIPAKAVAITFDDGYQDNYAHAFPLLKRHGLPATVFLATGSMDNANVLWHERIFDAFRFAAVSKAALKDWPNLKVVLDTQEQANTSLKEIIKVAKQMPAGLRTQLIEDLEGELKPDPEKCRRVPMLTWAQAREMLQAGISFGSHTVSHPILSRISTDQARSELLDSKREIESRLGIRVTGFAYPNGQAGDYGPAIIRLLKESGYEFAMTTQSGINRAGDDLFQLKRAQPWPENPELFRLQLFSQRHGFA